jgi:hypothetical protein
MEAPIIAQWGPALWTLLHYLAERSGKTRPQGRMNWSEEEKRLWRGFLIGLRLCIPCPMCRTHYNTFYMENRIDPLFQQEDWGIALRTWLWRFHNEVRTSKGQPLILSLEDLGPTYASMSLEHYVKAKQTLTEHLRRGLSMRMYVRDDMVKCLRFMEELRICVES